MTVKRYNCGYDGPEYAGTDYGQCVAFDEYQAAIAERNAALAELSTLKQAEVAAKSDRPVNRPTRETIECYRKLSEENNLGYLYALGAVKFLLAEHDAAQAECERNAATIAAMARRCEKFDEAVALLRRWRDCCKNDALLQALFMLTNDWLATLDAEEAKLAGERDN